MHFEYTIVINQPMEKIFNYVSNPANLPEWQGPPTEIRDLQQTTPAQLRNDLETLKDLLEANGSP